MSRNQCS